MKKILLFDKYLKTKTYSDQFGYHPIWNSEIEKWLQSIGLEYLEKYKGRFGQKGREKQRDNFLAELCVHYYLSKRLKWELKELSPIGNDRHELEFVFVDRKGVKWHCEVKNSSWETEIINGDGTKAEKLARIKQPKYIKGEKGRSFSPADSYVSQIAKASKQFRAGNNNLLVILPDTFVTPTIDPYLKQNIEEATPADSPITAVAILDRYLMSGAKRVKYSWRLLKLN